VYAFCPMCRYELEVSMAVPTADYKKSPLVKQRCRP